MKHSQRYVILSIVMIIMLAGVGSGALDDNLVLYQTLDQNGTFTDVSGNSYSGTNLGNAVWKNHGRWNGYYNFTSASSQYIENVSAQDIVSSTYPFTINVWLKAVGTGEMTAFCIADETTYNNYYGVGSNNGKASLFIRNLFDGGGSQKLMYNGTVNDGAWHMVTGVFKSNTERELYMDGVFQSEQTENIRVSGTVDRWRIGSKADSNPSEYMNGLVDDVAVWSRALSTTEITNLFNGMGIVGSNLYVSENGLDTNDGYNTSSPIKTLAEVRQHELRDGDKILLNSSNTFRGYINLIANNTNISSFGTGTQPKILGSVSGETTWTSNGGNTYRLSGFTLEPNILFYDTNVNKNHNYGNKETTFAGLNANWDWWYNSTNDNVYVYHSSGSPQLQANGIEIPTYGVDLANDIMFYVRGINNSIDNINVSYANDIGIYLFYAHNSKIHDVGINYIYEKAVYYDHLENHTSDLLKASYVGYKGIILNSGGEAFWISLSKNVLINSSEIDNPRAVAYNCYKTDNAIIENSYIHDGEYYANAYAEGIYFDACNNSRASYNNVSSTSVGLSINAENVNAEAWNITMNYNIVNSCNSSLIISNNRDVTTLNNIVIDHNTFVRNKTRTGHEHDITLDDVNGLEFTNNIISDTNSTFDGAILRWRDSDTINVNSDYNLWYSLSGAYKFNLDSGYYGTFALYQSGTGNDSNSLDTDSSFLSGTYQPSYDSPACGTASDGGDIGALECESLPGPTGGLVLYMPFFQSTSNTTYTKDYSNESNDGTVIGATLTDNHNSYDFASQGQYIDFGNPTSLNFNNVSFTLSGWINSNGPDTGGDMIYGKKKNDNTRGYDLRLKSTGALRLSLREEGGSERTYETVTLLDFYKWYYVTVVIEQPTKEIHFYIDGKLDRTVSCTNCQVNVGEYADNFRIASYGYTGNTWNGSLDNMRVYGEALDATNISTLYLAGHGDTIYVSNSTGSDSNNGLSESLPIKTLGKLNSITNNPGDTISLKSGDVWNERLYFYNESGNKDFPITISNYGSGNIPEIGGRFNLYNTSSANWSLEYSNVYSTKTNTDPYRVWLNGTEYSESVNSNSVNDYDRWYYDSVNDKLYIYATQNPYNEYNVFLGTNGINDFFSSLYIELSDYLSFSNINITGNSIGIYIEGGQNNIFDNIYTGYYSMYSLATYGDLPTYKLSVNNSIINSYIDSGYELKNNYSFASNDGIKLNEGTNHTLIENNTIIGFGHNGIYIEGISNPTNYVEGASYNIIKNNSIYFNQLTYSRCFSVDGNGTQAKNNNITNNRCYNATASDQINGNNNEYSYNIISVKTRSERSTKEDRSQGIDFETYSGGVSHDNLIDHNTIYQTCEAGISTRDTGETPHNHTITNNIIYNTGSCSSIYPDMSIVVEINAGLDYNYSNNLIYKTDLVTNTIDYRGSIYTVSDWNSADADGDDIKDNQYTTPLFKSGTLIPTSITASTMSTTGSYVGALNSSPIACIDSDGDGFNNSVADSACGSAIQLDCDDTNASVYPLTVATTFTSSWKGCGYTQNVQATNAITIGASDIVIDGNGGTIYRTGTADSRCLYSGATRSNVTIKNMNCYGYKRAILLTLLDSDIYNNTFNGTQETIFLLSGALKNTIQDNTINVNSLNTVSYSGIKLRDTNYTTIKNNIINDGYVGINLERADHNTIQDNTFNNQNFFGYYDLTENEQNDIYNNSFYNTSWNSIKYMSNNGIIADNYINSPLHHGIDLYNSNQGLNCEAVDIYGNTVTDELGRGVTGIFVSNCKDVLVYNNLITNLTNTSVETKGINVGGNYTIMYNVSVYNNTISNIGRTCIWNEGNNTLWEENTLTGCAVYDVFIQNYENNNPPWETSTFKNNVYSSGNTIIKLNEDKLNVSFNHTTSSSSKINLSNGATFKWIGNSRKALTIENNTVTGEGIGSPNAIYNSSQATAVYTDEANITQVLLPGTRVFVIEYDTGEPYPTSIATTITDINYSVIGTNYYYDCIGTGTHIHINLDYVEDNKGYTDIYRNDVFSQRIKENTVTYNVCSSYLFVPSRGDTPLSSSSPVSYNILRNVIGLLVALGFFSILLLPFSSEKYLNWGMKEWMYWMIIVLIATVLLVALLNNIFSV